MRIEVLFVVNGSTQSHRFTCKNASRQINPGTIIFRDGHGINDDGRKVIAALYSQAEAIVIFDED